MKLHKLERKYKQAVFYLCKDCWIYDVPYTFWVNYLLTIKFVFFFAENSKKGFGRNQNQTHYVAK